jgi:hypothetical protein
MSIGDPGGGGATERTTRSTPEAPGVSMARKNQQVESRMISEYMLQNYSKFTYTLAVPLGSLPQELLTSQGMARTMGIMRPYRPEVDALVVLPRYILIIEAKVWNVINGLSKLPLYKSLVPTTPELQQYMPREVLMQLVVGWTNPNLERMARDSDVSVVVFCPPWLQEIVNKMHDYWTSEARTLRDQKLAMREYFGIE